MLTEWLLSTGHLTLALLSRDGWSLKGNIALRVQNQKLGHLRMLNLKSSRRCLLHAILEVICIFSCHMKQKLYFIFKIRAVIALAPDGGSWLLHLVWQCYFRGPSLPWGLWFQVPQGSGGRQRSGDRQSRTLQSVGILGQTVLLRSFDKDKETARTEVKLWRVDAETSLFVATIAQEEKKNDTDRLLEEIRARVLQAKL